MQKIFKKRKKNQESQPAVAMPTAESTARRRRKLPTKFFGALALACVVALAVFGVSYLIFNQVSARSGATLYDQVQHYDFSQGRSAELEQKIKSAMEEYQFPETDSEYESYILTLRSKAEYYYRIQKYHTALSTLSSLEDYTRDETDRIYIISLYANVYEAMGNETLRDRYLAERDSLEHICRGGGVEADND